MRVLVQSQIGETVIELGSLGLALSESLLGRILCFDREETSTRADFIFSCHLEVNVFNCECPCRSQSIGPLPK